MTIRTILQGGMQGQHRCFAGQRPGVDVMNALDARHVRKIEFDGMRINARRRTLEQHMRGVARQLPAGTQDQHRHRQ